MNALAESVAEAPDAEILEEAEPGEAEAVREILAGAYKKASAAKRLRGFAAMPPAKQRAIAGKGGKTAHEKGTAHEFTKAEASAAGKKGGERVSRDREHMRAIGRRGGKTASADRDHMKEIGRRGGQAIAARPGHMKEIGRRGGEASPKKQGGAK